MKPVCLLLISIFSCLGAGAQTYMHFPSANTTWGEIYRANDDSVFRAWYYGLKNSDTVLNSVTYHKLYRSSDTVFQEAEFWGGIREDSATRRVYFYGFSGWANHTEILLYDFSLQTGDSLRYSDNNGANNWHVNTAVTSVDSVYINGQYHRRITIDGPMPSAWVEGVGNLVRGVVYSSGNIPYNGNWSELVCMKQDSSWTYHHTQSWLFPTHVFPPCEELSIEGQGIKDIVFNSGAAVLVPNPATADVTIRITETAGSSITGIMVTDMLGRPVALQKISLAAGAITLPSAQWNPGIYFVKLLRKNAPAVVLRLEKL